MACQAGFCAGYLVRSHADVALLVAVMRVVGMLLLVLLVLVVVTVLERVDVEVVGNSVGWVLGPLVGMGGRKGMLLVVVVGMLASSVLGMVEMLLVVVVVVVGVVVVVVVVVVLVVVVVVARSPSVLRLALWKYLAPLGCAKDCIVDLPSPDWANLQILYTR